MSNYESLSTVPGQPRIRVDIEALTERVAAACRNNNITTDAGWSTFVAARFNSTNASGLTVSTRTFLIEFFDKLIKVG
jgi:hypothetical protein